MTKQLVVTERRRLTAIRAARLFDGAGSAFVADPLVVLDGATILGVESGGTAPEGAEVVDLGGTTLLPGLIDTHVHLAFDASTEPVARLAARTGEQALAAMAEAGRASLPGGGGGGGGGAAGGGGVPPGGPLGPRHFLALPQKSRKTPPPLRPGGPANP